MLSLKVLIPCCWCVVSSATTHPFLHTSSTTSKIGYLCVKEQDCYQHYCRDIRYFQGVGHCQALIYLLMVKGKNLETFSYNFLSDTFEEGCAYIFLHSVQFHRISITTWHRQQIIFVTQGAIPYTDMYK